MKVSITLSGDSQNVMKTVARMSKAADKYQLEYNVDMKQEKPEKEMLLWPRKDIVPSAKLSCRPMPR